MTRNEIYKMLDIAVFKLDFEEIKKISRMRVQNTKKLMLHFGKPDVYEHNCSLSDYLTNEQILYTDV